MANCNCGWMSGNSFSNGGYFETNMSNNIANNGNVAAVSNTGNGFGQGQTNVYDNYEVINGEEYSVANQNYYNNHHQTYNHYYTTDYNYIRDHYYDYNVYHNDSIDIYTGSEYHGTQNMVAGASFNGGTNAAGANFMTNNGSTLVAGTAGVPGSNSGNNSRNCRKTIPCNCCNRCEERSCRCDDKCKRNCCHECSCKCDDKCKRNCCC